MDNSKQFLGSECLVLQPVATSVVIVDESPIVMGETEAKINRLVHVTVQREGKCMFFIFSGRHFREIEIEDS